MFLRSLFGAALLAFTGLVQAAALQLQVYNPGEAAVFPVSSTLISGEREALLVDAQFSTREAAELVGLIKASGKRLTSIYISHGDPDFYFGLQTLKQAFPEARVLATAATIEHIRATQAGKLAYWGPILKDGAPSTIIIPEPLPGDRLTLEGQELQVIGLDPERTTLWIPSLKAVVGGVLVDAGEHVWTADTQTAQSRRDWLASLDQIEALQPQVLVPGHYLGDVPHTLAALRFTRGYLKTLELELAKTDNATALIEAMQRRYPRLPGESSLELSAKVLKGEMQWP
ncbi:MBL fold metallo-hydrolase [Pseudomonas sp. BMS12]|uniref:MBL fold metallo-hydrolase n=1 Tax=Pseudomonas sp. BMS12 TaxID=1796033 RepID=UPI00083A7BAE|nr:MBL fold metallo-hydrolase [Pseudomonas sp. BMS12]